MKILFVDLDDTLLNSDKTISEENISAIRQMVEAGNALVLCTGRPLYSVMLLAREYGFIGKNYYVAAFNGGQIVDTADMKELYHEGLERDCVKRIFEMADSKGLPVQTYTDDFVIIEKESEFIKWYTDRIRMPYKVVKCALDEVEGKPFKCVVGHIDNHALLEEFKAEIEPLLPGTVQNLFSNPHLLEFGPVTATKGVAVAVLCRLLGIDIKDSIAVGDEGNDVSMIEVAGIGVAMINGTESVKEVADVITENDNNHAAIKEVIEKYILNK